MSYADPSWTLPIQWVMFGLAVLLIVYAARPSRLVGIGAIVFAIVAAAVAGKIFVDARNAERAQQAFVDCVQKSKNLPTGMQKCAERLGITKMGFVGNEAYAN